MKKFTPILLLALVAASCSDAGEESVTPEILNQRRAAFRQACAAAELTTQAAADVATIEEVLADIDPADPMAEISQMASEAALGFARAYAAHAALRVAAYAYLDSAVNYATNTADSALYLGRAASIGVRSPEPGSVEENVLVSYTENLNAILQNPDHKCNWDIPF